MSLKSSESRKKCNRVYINKLVATDCWHKHSQAKEKIGRAVTFFFKWNNIQPDTISLRHFFIKEEK